MITANRGSAQSIRAVRGHGVETSFQDDGVLNLRTLRDVSQFVVSPDGSTEFSRLRDALAKAARAATSEIPACVVVGPGTYDEDVVVCDYVSVVGMPGALVRGSVTVRAPKHVGGKGTVLRDLHIGTLVVEDNSAHVTVENCTFGTRRDTHELVTARATPDSYVEFVNCSFVSNEHRRQALDFRGGNVRLSSCYVECDVHADMDATVMVMSTQFVNGSVIGKGPCQVTVIFCVFGFDRPQFDGYVVDLKECALKTPHPKSQLRHDHCSLFFK